MGWRPVALPLVGLFAAGCAVSDVDLRDSLDLNQASFQDKLAAQQVLIDEFSACTARPYEERTATRPTSPPRMPGTSPTGLCRRFTRSFVSKRDALLMRSHTAGGVIAKKLVEHGGFCYFQTIQQGERLREGIKL